MEIRLSAGVGCWAGTARTDKLDNGIKSWYHSRVQAIHHETLSHIFNKRIGGMRSWDLTVSMLKALGDNVKESDRNNIAVELNGVVGIFHRHRRSPLVEMTKRSVDNMRDFLEKAGVKP